MNETMKLFLAILKAALSKTAFQGDIPEARWPALSSMADIHKVLPLFYEAVYHSSAPAALKPSVRQQVIAQTMRTADFLQLNDHLQAAGLRPVVVKGIVCRSLYPQPDHRPSADEDLWVTQAQFDRWHQLLTEFGMNTAVSPEVLSTSYEVPYRKEGSLLYIELHKHLFPPESLAYGDLNRFFDQAYDRAVAVQIQGHTIYTLNPTDHLFYLICHAFKHFLHSGFGIRQVCDIILYANEHGKSVNWEQILQYCTSIRAEKFAAALFRIGSEYLVFDPQKACYPEAWQEISVDAQPMLEDLLCAGVYGGASMSRQHSSTITLDAVAAQKQGRKAKSSVIASVFPSAAKLESRYPYLKKHPYLLPMAWCSRLWSYRSERRHSVDNSAADALKIGKERLELMKLYGILE